MNPPNGDEPPAPLAPSEQLRCYRHPNREALVRCTRCDRPICPECMREASVGFHCPDDVSLARRTVRAPRTSMGARILNSPPYVTVTLVLANVVVYVLTARESVGGIRQPGDGSSHLFRSWQLVPFVVHSHHDYYRLLTATFLHVNLLHIGSNMLALALVGPPLERLLGPWRFALLYVLSGIGGSALVYAFGNVYTAEVGASGAIFGLFAACLVMVRQLRFDPQIVIGTIVVNFILTFSIHNISKLGHVGGFAAGVLLALAIAGIPRRTQRMTSSTQLMGIAGVAALIVAAVLLRTATF